MTASADCCEGNPVVRCGLLDSGKAVEIYLLFFPLYLPSLFAPAIPGEKQHSLQVTSRATMAKPYLNAEGLPMPEKSSSNVKIYDRPERKGPSPMMLGIALVKPFQTSYLPGKPEGD
jgi:hypothetical protein